MRRTRAHHAMAGTAVIWPLAARAQQSSAVPVIGLLGLASSYGLSGSLPGLMDTGYVEGQNLVIEYR